MDSIKKMILALAARLAEDEKSTLDELNVELQESPFLESPPAVDCENQTGEVDVEELLE